MLNLSVLMRSSGFFAGADVWLLAGIVAAACVLGAEVAGIGILIRKFIRARKNKQIQEAEEERRYYRDYGIAALGFAAIPLTAGTVFYLLVALAAVAAVVFLALLIIFRLCGYTYIHSKHAEEPAEEPAVTRTVAEKQPVEETYISLEEDSAEPEKQTEEEPQEPVREPEPEDEPEEAVAAFAEEPAPAGGMAPVNSGAQGTVPGAGSNGPVRIVHIEKQYTETVKEVQTPAPAPANTQENAQSNSNGRVEELLSTLVEKIDQIKNNDSGKQPPETDVARPSDPIDEEEEEDENELDEDVSANGADADDEEEVDNEPDDPEHFTGNERIIGFDEKTGCYIVAHYRKSFEAKLIQSRPAIKHYYSELKNALMAYKGTKSRISWGADSFHNGRTAIAKINVKTRSLEICFALDPASLEGTVYRGQDVGHLKKYADTPFRYKLRTERKFRWALELVQRTCEEQGLSPIDIEQTDYEARYPFEETESLIARGQIKEYIREEKPASTFELDETHVPSSVAGVDETVIPANANISWEIDNDRPVEPEPVPEPTPEPQPEPQPQPQPEPQPAPAPAEPAATGTVVRETTKVTQMRYTEHYYGVPDAPKTYQQYLTDEPFTTEAFFETPVDGKTAEPETAETIETVETTEPVESAEPAAVADDVQSVDEPVPAEETSEAEEVPEEESEEPEEEPRTGMLSAFENDRVEPEEDLDWGIPASLTISVEPQTVAEESTEEPEEPAEEVSEEMLEEVPEEIPEELPAEEPEPDDGADTGYAEIAEYTEDAPETEYALPEYADENGYGNEFYADQNDVGENAYADEAYASDEYADEPGYTDENGYTEETGYADDGYAEYSDENAYTEYAEYNDTQYAGAQYSEDAYTDGVRYADDAEYAVDTGEGYYGEGAYAEDAGSYEETYSEPVSVHVNPEIALMDISMLDAHFPNGSVIDLETLKAKGLVLPSAKVLKFYSSGSVSKAFTVIADHFSLDALQAIDNAGGESRMTRK